MMIPLLDPRTDGQFDAKDTGRLKAEGEVFAFHAGGGLAVSESEISHQSIVK